MTEIDAVDDAIIVQGGFQTGENAIGNAIDDGLQLIGRQATGNASLLRQ
jgi:hypothetical protein